MPDSLNNRLKRWLMENASEVTADAFLPKLRPQLRQWGLSPTGPISDDDWEVVRDRLDEEMEQIGWEHLENAAAEAERAREKGQTLREWIRDVYSRILPEEKARQFASRAEAAIKAHPSTADLDAPPAAPDILSYRLMLNEIGGGAVLATAQQNPRLN